MKKRHLRPQFFNFLFYRFFGPDWAVGGRNKNKFSCVLLYFFIKKIGGQKKYIELGYGAHLLQE